jgi:hypothetical protein
LIVAKSQVNASVFTAAPLGFMSVNEKVRGRVKSGARVAVAVPAESIVKLPRDFDATGFVEICCAASTVILSSRNEHLNVFKMLLHWRFAGRHGLERVQLSMGERLAR